MGLAEPVSIEECRLDRQRLAGDHQLEASIRQPRERRPARLFGSGDAELEDGRQIEQAEHARVAE
jgi:hypothetical protein